MKEPLFMFDIQGISGNSTGFRPGARHELIIFVVSPVMETARETAMAAATKAGWLHLDLQSWDRVDDDADALEGALGKAAVLARGKAVCIAIHPDEVPLNG